MKDLTEYPMPWWSVPFWIVVGLLWALALFCIAGFVAVVDCAATVRKICREDKQIAKSFRVFLLAMFALLAGDIHAATNSISFDLGNFGADSVAFKLVRIAPSAQSFPRVEGSTVRGLDYGFRTTDSNGRFTNSMVTGTYDITFTNRFRATTFQITVPETNFAGILTAAELTTSGTNLPSNLAAYSQAAANARFALKWSLASNGVVVSASPTQINLVGFDKITNENNKISVGASGGSGSGDISTSSSNNILATVSNAAQRIVVDVMNFGAAGDTVLTSGSISSNSTFFTNATALSSADIGKRVLVFGAATTNEDFYAVINSINGNVATVSRTASNTVTDARAYIGTDDTLALHRAYQVAITNGAGAIRFPKQRDGRKFWLMATNFLDMTDASNGVAKVFALTFTNSSVTIEGAGTELFSPGGFRRIGDYCVRPSLFGITGVTNITLHDLDIDTGITNAHTGVYTFPARVSDGDGWDTSHHLLIELFNSVEPYPTDVRLNRIRARGFRGEMVHVGTEAGGTLYVTDSFLEGGNATILNPVNALYVRDTHFIGGNTAFEVGQYKTKGASVISGSTFTNMTKGITITGASTNQHAPILISGNFFYRLGFELGNGAIETANAKDVSVIGNTFLHCGYGFLVASSGAQGSEPGITNLTISGNQFLGTNGVGVGIGGVIKSALISGNLFDVTNSIDYGAATIGNVVVSGNYFIQGEPRETAGNTGQPTFIANFHGTNAVTLGTRTGFGTNLPQAVLHVHGNAILNGSNNLRALSYLTGGNARDVNGNIYVTNGTGIADVTQAHLTAASNSLMSEVMTASNNLYSTETTRNAAVSNAVMAYGGAISNLLVANDTTTSNGLVNIAGAQTITGTKTIGSFTVNTQIVLNGQFVRVPQRLGNGTMPVGLAATNLYTLNTNASFGFTLSGTPTNGQLVTLVVSNTALATDILATNLGTSVFDFVNRSNVTEFAIGSNSMSLFGFRYLTNFGAPQWYLEQHRGFAYAIAAGNQLSTSTNGDTVYFNLASATLTNLAGSGAITNLRSAGNTNTTMYSLVQNGTNTTGAIKTVTPNANQIALTELGSTNFVLTLLSGLWTTNFVEWGSPIIRGNATVTNGVTASNFVAIAGGTNVFGWSRFTGTFAPVIRAQIGGSSSNASVGGTAYTESTGRTNMGDSISVFTNLAVMVIPANALTNNLDRYVLEWGGFLAIATANTNNFQLTTGSNAANTVLDTGVQISSNGTFSARVTAVRISANLIRLENPSFSFHGTIGNSWSTTNANSVILALDTGTNNFIALRGAARRRFAHTNDYFYSRFEPVSQ